LPLPTIPPNFYTCLKDPGYLNFIKHSLAATYTAFHVVGKGKTYRLIPLSTPLACR